MSTGRIRAIVGILAAMFSGGAQAQERITKEVGMNPRELMNYKDSLILNSFAGPMPHRLPNQRQRRKRLRQVPQLRR